MKFFLKLVIVLCLFGCISSFATETERRRKSNQLRSLAKQYIQGSSEWLALIDRAIEMDPNNPEALRSRAVWAIKTGSYIYCFELLDRAVKIDPQYLEVRAAYKLFSARNYLEGIKDLKAYDALNKQPDFIMDHSVQYCLGIAYKELGEYKKAILEFNKAIVIKNQMEKTNPDIWTYYFRGLCFYKLGDYKRALKDFNYLIELFPQCPEAYYYLGKTYLKLGNKEMLMQSFILAKKFYANHIRWDKYLEQFDPVYLADIKHAISQNHEVNNQVLTH